MLSYQHIYHAGNFADIHKHCILTQVIKALQIKPSPIYILDTHAGRGIYDLQSAEAEKNREFDNGITHFWQMRDQKTYLSPLLDIIKTLNPDGTLQKYPGSAYIARTMVKPSSRMTAVERHPGEYEELKASLPNAEILQEDGLQVLLQKLPPQQQRSLAIIDPSYEIKTEYAEVPKKLEQAWRKWSSGCYVLWYPIMDTGLHHAMITAIRKSSMTNVLVSEIKLDKPPEAHFRMTGSGLLIINPPWPENILADITTFIATQSPAKTVGDVFWLDNKQIDVETGMIA